MSILSKLVVMGIVFLSLSVRADVALSPVFGNNMVLQRDRQVAIFGSADPGQEISVSIQNQTKTTTADGSGNWRLSLDPMSAGGPFVLTVTGSNTITLSDVLIGEVWFCSGQSNMANRIFDEEYVNDVANDSYPQIRIKHNSADWTKMQSQNEIQWVSAEGYFFAKELYNATQIPIGIIVAAFPATRIQEYMDPQSLVENPDAFFDADGITTIEYGRHYNALISKIAGYTIQGALWNQGESNWQYEQYGRYLRSMITNWRIAWNDDFFFIVQQLPANLNEWHPRQVSPGQPNQTIADIRQAQFDALSLPHTALLTTIDICDGQVHPHNKKEVAQRALLIAQKYTLHEDIECMGPIYDYSETNGNQLILHFIHAGNGLALSNGDTQIKNMAIAGDDNVWYWAQAQITGNSVALTHPSVAVPTQAKYCYGDVPEPVGNLTNSSGVGCPTFATYSKFRPHEAVEGSDNPPEDTTENHYTSSFSDKTTSSRSIYGTRVREEVKLFNSIGRCVATTQLNGSGVNCAGLRPGAYFMDYGTGKGQPFHRRILIK